MHLAIIMEAVARLMVKHEKEKNKRATTYADNEGQRVKTKMDRRIYRCGEGEDAVVIIMEAVACFMVKYEELKTCTGDWSASEI